MPFPAPNWQYRIGRRQRAALRAFIGYGPVLSGTDLFPCSDMSGRVSILAKRIRGGDAVA
jgi:hypothetical protein